MCWAGSVRLGRAQAVEAFNRLLQLGIEAADAEPRQRRLHSVDDPALLANETFALALGRLASSCASVGIATILQ